MIPEPDPDPDQERADVPEPATTPRPDAPPARDERAEPAAPAMATRATPAKAGHTVVVRDLHAYYGDNHAVRGVDLTFRANHVTALIGPSGCGKSTLVRCINRMHEEIPGARAEGSVTLGDTDIYDPSIDPTMVRRVIGMVFQKPNPFPTMSIFDNVAAGLRLSGRRGLDLKSRVEWALQGAGLWDEVRDRLGSPGVSLSGGQQQRLCIARTIAVEPEVILMDEPASALDPIATLKIEDLVDELKERFTIVIVTHNMQQAARVADTTAFMLNGELVEHGPTEKIFSTPDDSRTEDYVTGKFG
jgi:phosphate transport system ATP-binding protein